MSNYIFSYVGCCLELTYSIIEDFTRMNIMVSRFANLFGYLNFDAEKSGVARGSNRS